MNNIKPKLIALDVDGTIMDRNYKISQRVKQAVAYAFDSGVYVVIATGRMYSATVPIAIELGLKTPIISYQGSLVKEFYHSEDELLHHTINKELTNELINDLRKENVQINVYFDDKLHVETVKPILEEYAARRNIPYYLLKAFDDVTEFLPTKILAMHEDPAKVEDIKLRFRQKYSDSLYITKSTDYFCEFVDKKCSKAKAILFLAEKWGIDKSEIMAIGDHDNDIEMIQAANIGVAMGNATEGLKLAARYHTETVSNDGAALAIERFVL